MNYCTVLHFTSLIVAIKTLKLIFTIFISNRPEHKHFIVYFQVYSNFIWYSGFESQGIQLCFYLFLPQFMFCTDLIVWSVSIPIAVIQSPSW